MINYDVALHSANWPTFQALQECIDRRGWPVKLDGEASAEWTKPLGKVPRTLGIPVVFKGEPIQLEASFVTLGGDQRVAINNKLSSIGATGRSFDEGDRVLTLTLRANIKEYQAGFYVMAALIKCFDGYGFHGRSHGASHYADALVSEAAALDSEGTTPIQPDDVRVKRMLDGFLDLSNKQDLRRK